MAKIKTEIRKKIIKFYELIKNIYPVKKIFVFGSHANGTSHKDSDIDLGVVVDLPENTDFIDLNVKMFHYADKIDTSFEPKCISWKDYKSHPSASILSEIIRTGIYVISA